MRRYQFKVKLSSNPLRMKIYSGWWLRSPVDFCEGIWKLFPNALAVEWREEQ